MDIDKEFENLMNPSKKPSERKNFKPKFTSAKDHLEQQREEAEEKEMARREQTRRIHKMIGGDGLGLFEDEDLGGTERWINSTMGGTGQSFNSPTKSKKSKVALKTMSGIKLIEESSPPTDVKFEDKMNKIKAHILNRKKVDDMLAGIGVALTKKRFNVDGISENTPADKSAKEQYTKK